MIFDLEVKVGTAYAFFEENRSTAILAEIKRLNRSDGFQEEMLPFVGNACR